MSSTTWQESWGENELKKVNVECDTDENFKDNQGFFTVFLAIMFLSLSWEPIFASKSIFSSILNLFTLIYCIKDYPTELKDSLFEVFKLLVCFHTKWGKFMFLVAGFSVHGFLKCLVCDIWGPNKNLREIRDPSFLIYALLKIITPPYYVVVW
jgi:hypothetical protein